MSTVSPAGSNAGRNQTMSQDTEYSRSEFVERAARWIFAITWGNMIEEQDNADRFDVNTSGKNLGEICPDQIDPACWAWAVKLAGEMQAANLDSNETARGIPELASACAATFTRQDFDFDDWVLGVVHESMGAGCCWYDFDGDGEVITVPNALEHCAHWCQLERVNDRDGDPIILAA